MPRRSVAGAVINGSEILMLLAAVVILLSMLGINLSGLLIPAGVAAALASKDLAHNFLAGFFLFAVQVQPPAGALPRMRSSIMVECRLEQNDCLPRFGGLSGYSCHLHLVPPPRQVRLASGGGQS